MTKIKTAFSSLQLKQKRQLDALDHMGDMIFHLEEHVMDNCANAEEREIVLKRRAFLSRVRRATRYNLDVSLGEDPSWGYGCPFNVDPRMIAQFYAENPPKVKAIQVVITPEVDDDPDDSNEMFDEPYDALREEEEAEQRTEKAKAHLRGLSNEDLGKEWERECGRHDSAVDRCEQINSPTIEDAQGWMNFIEGVFKERGVNHHDFVLNDTVVETGI